MKDFIKLIDFYYAMLPPEGRLRVKIRTSGKSPFVKWNGTTLWRQSVNHTR